jgi:creatinine amidohydrolase
MSHPAYRAKYLPAMTRAQIDALPGRASAIVIVPTGSVEQHGPHLPVGVDSILGQAWLTAALPLIPATVPVYVGPAVTYGKSNEHLGFPGTLTISAATLRRLVLSIARQVHALGFRTLAILNTHGGNTAVLVATIREIQAALDLNAGLIAPGRPAVGEREERLGIHAGRIETSWMLAVAPNLVHMKRAVREFPSIGGKPAPLDVFDGPATRGWMMRDLSRSGVLGDAAAADAAEGRAWFDAGARVLASRIVELAARVARS